MNISFCKGYALVSKETLVRRAGSKNSLQSSIYLFDIENQSIQKQPSTIEGDVYIEACPYDPSFFVIIASNFDRTKASVTHLLLVDTKDIYMQMLLHLEEDIDDDLLIEAIDLLL